MHCQRRRPACCAGSPSAEIQVCMRWRARGEPAGRARQDQRLPAAWSRSAHVWQGRHVRAVHLLRQQAHLELRVGLGYPDLVGARSHLAAAVDDLTCSPSVAVCAPSHTRVLHQCNTGANGGCLLLAANATAAAAGDRDDNAYRLLHPSGLPR